ncbi:MAG: hemolysin family protein, partial [Pseudomonadota bacterium]
ADAPSPSPSEMRLRVAEFQNARVRDVMIPRVEISAVEIDADFDDLLKIFAEETHSRLPIYRGSLDDPVGFVHIKDVVAELSQHANGEAPQDDKPLRRLLREILFVPASMRLQDLLVKMQSSRIHLALVVDEYGGTDGLVSLEDLVEQIVGDIEDEHDEDEALIQARGGGVWEVDARADIEDFEAEAKLSLALPDYEDEIDTLGGLVFALAGRVPERGEIVTHPHGVDFEVVDADPRRIKRLRARCGAARKKRTDAVVSTPASATGSGGTSGAERSARGV